MNLNIMLIVFVLLGFTIFKATYESENNGTVNSSIINSLSGTLLIPSIDDCNGHKLSANTTANNTNNNNNNTSNSCIANCDGTFSCIAAVGSAIIDFLFSIIFIVVDIILFAIILVAVLIIPIPGAPTWVQLIFYTLEAGGLYIIVGMFRGGE